MDFLDLFLQGVGENFFDVLILIIIPLVYRFFKRYTNAANIAAIGTLALEITGRLKKQYPDRKWDDVLHLAVGALVEEAKKQGIAIKPEKAEKVLNGYGRDHTTQV